MNRRLIAAISIAAANGVCTSSGLATLTIDLRATSTSSGVIIDSKNVYFTGQPGGTIRIDAFALITDMDSDLGNQGLVSLAGSFLSSNGGLFGDLVAARAPNFNATGSSVGKLQDLDGDGDLDVGSNNDASSANFFSARVSGPTPAFGAEILVGTLTWTRTGGTADTSISFRKRSAATSATWFEDGSQITSNNWFNGTPVTMYTPEPAGALGALVAAGLLARRRGRS